MPPDNISIDNSLTTDTAFIDSKCTATSLYTLTPVLRDIFLEAYNKSHPDTPVTRPISDIHRMSSGCKECDHSFDVGKENYCIKLIPKESYK